MAKDFYSKSNLGFHSMELTKLKTIELLTKLHQKMQIYCIKQTCCTNLLQITFLSPLKP